MPLWDCPVDVRQMGMAHPSSRLARRPRGNPEPGTARPRNLICVNLVRRSAAILRWRSADQASPLGASGLRVLAELAVEARQADPKSLRRLAAVAARGLDRRSEEHTSELQSPKE